MYLFLYNILIFLLAILCLPYLLFQMFIKGKYKKNFLKRIGFQFPSIDKKNKKLIWIHAVSVGETKAVTPLIKLIRNKYKNCLILISSVTETGHLEAKKNLPFIDYHVFLPFDFAPIISPIIQKSSPDLVILSETDYWLQFLSAAKKQGAKIAVVNGKISERSTNRLKKISFFTKKLFSNIDLICVQSSHYLTRFLDLRIDNKKLTVTGNLKFDDNYPLLTEKELNEWKNSLGISNDAFVIAIGSTHDPEEQELLKIFSRLWESYPQIKIILVPRHPERFNKVANLLEKENIAYGRITLPETLQKNNKVILVDAMGLLKKCYQISKIAIVGGSFTEKVGGHNILEPCWYGVPVLFGPYLFSQPELLDIVLRFNAGKQVTLETVESELMHLIQKSELRQMLAENGLKMMKEINGATQKTFLLLEEKGFLDGF
ncbi:MAG: hypothetical protein BGO10_00165 [Chlamydia sp. 32-24]|nr:MAG: hypothetical protein BGO10_00165 [Chlamydia sp. 32-24]